MAKNINIDEIGVYFRGVAERAEHHGHSVKNTIYFLLGVVLRMSDSGLMVRTYKGEVVNVVWFYLNDRRYCLTYNHENGTIELRDNSCRGKCLYEYNDEVSLDVIFNSFKQIKYKLDK